MAAATHIVAAAADAPRTKEGRHVPTEKGRDIDRMSTFMPLGFQYDA